MYSKQGRYCSNTFMVQRRKIGRTCASLVTCRKIWEACLDGEVMLNGEKVRRKSDKVLA